MRNVIITGADGFVGSNTVEYFLKQGKEILGIDIADTPRRLPVHPKLKYLKLDISEISEVEKSILCNEYDTFIHFAWAGSAGKERSDYNLQLKNATNTVELMKVAKKLGCKRFVVAGSIMEHEVEAAIHAQGTKPGTPYIYGLGKFIAHGLCKTVASEIDIELIWPMITNAYGVGELSPRFVNTTLRKMINNEPLQFTAATQNYDFIYISDVARAFYLVAERGKSGCEYIIGSGQARPLKEFIKEMKESCAPDADLHFGDIPFTGTNLPLSVFNAEDINRDCGFVPDISFGEGTRKTMEWLRRYDSKI